METYKHILYTNITVYRNRDCFPCEVRAEAETRADHLERKNRAWRTLNLLFRPSDLLQDIYFDRFCVNLLLRTEGLRDALNVGKDISDTIIFSVFLQIIHEFKIYEQKKVNRAVSDLADISWFVVLGSLSEPDLGNINNYGKPSFNSGSVCWRTLNN
jgi:hypothetical protein